ncbi:hypothetical protein [uncultured Kordia sp.]|uniref:hypothetical protein n=1 Tax=uncultured Kordia sp. TaxID=507699 RepID=UPI002631097D|nr:hypothetical protein [uncultured Kordia sp.]
MNTTYTSLFSIAILHTYFVSGICESLVFNPSSESKKIIDTYGLIIRKMPDGFQVYTSTNQPIKDYLNYIKQVTGADTFEFNGVVTDQNFYNYTAEIPVNEIGILSYENNGKTSVPTILEKAFSPQSDTEDIVLIKIKFEDIINVQENNTNLTFQVQLTARKTQWQYYIINNSNQNYHKIAIQSNTEEVQFSNEGEVTLQNGQKAVLFSSGTTTIPLKNKSQYSFEIINTKQTIAGNRKETIFKGLPIPNTSNLKILEDNNIASPMYVYI